MGSVPVPGLDALATTGLAFTAGGLGLAPVTAVAAGGLRLDASPTAVALLVALAVGPTAVAYTLYFRGLRTVAAGTAAVIMVVEPLTGAGLAAVVLHDRLGLTGAAGGVLLGATVVLAARTASGHARAGVPYKRLLFTRGPLPTHDRAGSGPAGPRGGGERRRP